MFARRIIIHLVWVGLLVLGVVLPGCQSAAQGFGSSPFGGGVPKQWEPPIVEGELSE